MKPATTCDVPRRRSPGAATADDRARLGSDRPRVQGPYFFVGDTKFVVKAVSYGTFGANSSGEPFPERAQVRADFRAMREAQVNSLRTYSAPPAWLLDEAAAAGLRVLVGVYWRGCTDCSFDDAELLREACAAVRDAVRTGRGRPDAVLGYLIGNEVPPLVVRFHGWRTVERFLRKLYDAAKAEDLQALVSYGNYPSTEYLRLDFLDFHTLNVYLLQRGKLASYLDRMMIESGGRPLLIGETGDASTHRGEAWQAELLDWTIPLVLEKGCAGVCVFAWTDDWVVGGHRVEDWHFGLVTQDRRPKLAHAVVRRRFGQRGVEYRERPWPRVSVVVCNHNGGATLAETLESLVALDYPELEIIHVEDGSTDDSLAIARRFEPAVRVIAQENLGLSAARNVGLAAATGEYVAYIDSDAFADPDWVRHLVLVFESGDFAAVGGPNLTPPGDGLIAQLIALCPGNPTYVLEDNVRADHIAGVNMAFRRADLAAIGGFDPVHRRAGDDVDVCWRLQDAGYRLGFSPAAIVWHHRRPSIGRYLRQQYGYGEAENQLERKHPERFNLGGYIRWNGRVYTAPKAVSRWLRPFIYHGRLGEGMFQTLYQKEPSFLIDGPAMVHWYALWILALLLTPVSFWFGIVGAALMALSLWSAAFAALTTRVNPRLTPWQQVQKLAVVGSMHFLHPLVRSAGRIRARLREPIDVRSRLPQRAWLRPRVLLAELATSLRRPKETRAYWGDALPRRALLLDEVRREVAQQRIHAVEGREWDNHDLLLRGALASRARLFTAAEHFGRAIRFGFKIGAARGLLVVLVAASLLLLLASAYDWRFAPLLLLPASSGVLILAERARLRARTWNAIEAVAARRKLLRIDR